MRNPFSIIFGKAPMQHISRLVQTNKVIEAFTDPEPTLQVYILTGVRGCGKTVMLSTIAQRIREDDNWIVVELNPERDMLQSLASNLYSVPELYPLFVKAKLNLSAFGMGVSIENVPPITDIEVAIGRMLEHVSKAGKRVLITVDEAVNNENVRVFVAAFQIFLRNDYPLFLLMTGLYENIYNLQNEKSLTFMYRAPKIMLEPLNYTAMTAQYKKILGVDDEQAGKMAGITKGYSYAYQVLGYLMWENKGCDIEDVLPEFDQYMEEYVYDKIWSELSAKDKLVVTGIAKCASGKVTDIRMEIGMSTQEFSVYRDRLKKKGLIYVYEYGAVQFVLPRFDIYALKHL